MSANRIDRFGRLLVPKAMRERLGLRAGTELRLRIEGDALVIRVAPEEATLRLDGNVLVADVALTPDVAQP